MKIRHEGTAKVTYTDWSERMSGFMLSPNRIDSSNPPENKDSFPRIDIDIEKIIDGFDAKVRYYQVFNPNDDLTQEQIDQILSDMLVQANAESVYFNNDAQFRNEEALVLNAKNEILNEQNAVLNAENQAINEENEAAQEDLDEEEVQPVESQEELDEEEEVQPTGEQPTDEEEVDQEPIPMIPIIEMVEMIALMDLIPLDDMVLPEGVLRARLIFSYRYKSSLEITQEMLLAASAHPSVDGLVGLELIRKLMEVMTIADILENNVFGLTKEQWVQKVI